MVNKFKKYKLNNSESYDFHKHQINQQKLIDEIINEINSIKENERIIFEKLNEMNESINDNSKKIIHLKEKHRFDEYSYELIHDFNIINNSGLFDKEWYIKKYPSVKYFNINPIFHYLITWKESMNDPSSLFSTKSYYLFHEDVKDSGLNPLVHYIQKGKNENRLIFPSGRDIDEYDKQYMYNQLLIQQNVTNLRLKASQGYKINIVFIFYKTYWVNNILYKLFEKDDLFNVTLVITPYGQHYSNQEIKEYNETYQDFKNKGFNIIKGYDEENDKTIDLELECSPDIVFYATDWVDAYPKLLHINNIPQTALICYVPYSFMVSDLFESHTMNSEVIRKAWKFFCPTEFHKQKIIEKNINNLDSGKLIVSNYPKIDGMFLNEFSDESSYWKRNVDLDGNVIKRIIWAPHWTLGNGLLNYSTFESNFKFFYNYAESNPNIEWVFRPHPLLRKSIVDNEILSFEETEDYYKKWDELPNARYYRGTDYASLYEYSDAMITDSGSFLGEYLICNKPGLKLDKKTQKYNEIGELVQQYWYRCNGNDLEHIEKFINEVILGENDNLKNLRTEFVYKNLIPKEGITASEVIYNYIKSCLFKK